MINLKGRHLLTLLDYKPDEVEYLLDLAGNLKAKKKFGEIHKTLTGKNIALLFEKTSTRTRCAFEVAGMDLGLGVTFLDPQNTQMGHKESIADTARVLGRMYDGIEFRGYKQSTVEQLAQYSGVPVWNGLTDDFHPTQILADLLTIKERFGRLKGINFTYMGDARFNMGNSLMIGCALMGLNFTACSPEGYFPREELIEKAKKLALASGAKLRFTSSVEDGATGADVVYTDIWVSMGEPEDVWQERINVLAPYQVNKGVMNMAREGAAFMHCLPSYHDLNTAIGRKVFDKFAMPELEVTDEVFESENSIVFDEAENRMHTIKAVILATLSEPVL